MKKMIVEPLFQFFLLGAVLFVFLAYVSPEELHQQDQYLIRVDDSVLATYLQFQAKTFDRDEVLKKLAALDRAGRARLLENYVRDEVLVREALAAGLDQNDEVIRRRLMQKIEFIALGFNDGRPAITETQLRDYFSEHRDEYGLPASVSFTHVFFKRHQGELPWQQARDVQQALNAQKVPFSSASSYGDRFLFKRNYIDQSPDLIKGHFGRHFEQLLFELQPEHSWQGPFESEYGLHLVYLKDAKSPRLPELEEVSGTVLADMRRVEQQALQRQALERMRSKYRVEVEENSR